MSQEMEQGIEKFLGSFKDIAWKFVKTWWWLSFRRKRVREASLEPATDPLLGPFTFIVTSAITMGLIGVLLRNLEVREVFDSAKELSQLSFLWISLPFLILASLVERLMRRILKNSGTSLERVLRMVYYEIGWFNLSFMLLLMVVLMGLSGFFEYVSFDVNSMLPFLAVGFLPVALVARSPIVLWRDTREVFAQDNTDITLGQRRRLKVIYWFMILACVGLFLMYVLPFLTK